MTVGLLQDFELICKKNQCVVGYLFDTFSAVGVIENSGSNGFKYQVARWCLKKVNLNSFIYACSCIFLL